MHDDQSIIKDDVVQSLNDHDPELTGVELRDTLGKLGQELLCASQIYKQPRMNALAVFERLYNNDIPPKLRQMFNNVLPIFSGYIDELLAMFNDEIQYKVKSHNPGDYMIVPKIQAHLNSETKSMKKNAMWNYKLRAGRFNAALSGRIIGKIYTYNDPIYTNNFENVYYGDFHCQPNGGGILENHLFCGTEGNFRTQYELRASGKYDQEQVRKLFDHEYGDRFYENLEEVYGTRFARWQAVGLDILTNSFSGEIEYNLCDFIITYNGVRYNVVFEPNTSIVLYYERWTDVMPSGEFPYKSAATHIDDKNFWSKAYADDFFTIADAGITLFNQELTNREKKNYNARAYDKQMFSDVAKLDAAQYRPDGLVPADTMGGKKKIADGLYNLPTATMDGTVPLIEFMTNFTGSKTGADELPPASGKEKATRVMQQQAKQTKRVGLRTDEFKDYYRQLAYAFIEGMREFMPPSISVELVGQNGFIEKQELKRIDVRHATSIIIDVTSSSEQEQSDQLKKQGQVQAIETVAQNPQLTKYEKEIIYRNIGGFDESEIMFLLDTEGTMSKKQYSFASQAIEAILLDKDPHIYYGADLSYAKYVRSYFIDNKDKIMGKEKQFSEFLARMQPIIDENMKLKALEDAQKQKAQQQQNGQDQGGDQGGQGNNGKPQPKQQQKQPQPQEQ